MKTKTSAQQSKNRANKSVNLVTHSEPMLSIRDEDVLKNGINGLLDSVYSGLRSLTPIIGTTREFTDRERQACEFGLHVAQFVLQNLNTMGVGHKCE
jgi:hypothetical protein